MKFFRSRSLMCAILGGVSLAAAGAQTARGGPPTRPQPAANYTTISGTISQFNYDREAEIEGFLLNNHTLVQFGPRAAGRMSSLFHSGDSVEVSGFQQTSVTGRQSIDAQSVQDRTTGKTLSVPQPGAAAPYSATGRIRQLNYGPNGSVNGFVFDNGVFANVPPFDEAYPSSLRVGQTISYSGFARNTISGRTVVDVQNVTINGQALPLGPASPGAPPPAGAPAPPDASAPPAPPANAPPPPNGQAPSSPPAEQPAPPPAPPQS